MLLSREIAHFWPIRLRINSLLDNKTLCSYRNMSNNMSGVMALQRHVLNLLYSVLKFFKKSSATLKVLITVLKYLFKLIVKPICKFPYSAVATSSFLVGVRLGGTKRIKNVVSLKYFMVSKFSGYRKNTSYTRSQTFHKVCVQRKGVYIDKDT